MKKIITLLLIFTMCLVLCACDVGAILDGVGDMLDKDTGTRREDAAVDQMMPAGDGNYSGNFFYGISDEDGGHTVYIDEDGNVVSGSTNVKVEIIDGVVYINGEAVDMDIVTDGEGSYKVVTGTKTEE